MEDKFSARTLLPVLILALYVGAIWFVLLPPWKRDLLISRIMQTARANQQRASVRLLSARDEIEIARFRNLISRWEHDKMGPRDKPKGSD